ncbi:hypothetical protein [Algoriphagus terrigena]|uniref:hypothetical protein n=1 Tax=Algoriphagus terrigena TaxID=344884 RepID=UPI000421A48E|nr:hypothetical protein [Algoriphagus terrigena]
MKTNLFLILFFLAAIPIASFGQERPKLQYAAGFGPSFDNNIGLWGINFSNELNVRLGKRASFNTNLTFYQSLGSTKEQTMPQGEYGNDQSSGIFLTPSFKYDIIQLESGFKLALAVGPSLQLGGDAYTLDINYPTSDEPNYVYFGNKYQRIGLMTELEAEWKTKNPNVKNAASISAFGADKTFPWYVNLTYKVRFGLGKK